MAESKGQAVITLRMDDVAAAPAPTILADLMKTLDFVPKISQMPQETSRPGSSHMWLGSGKQHSNKWIASLLPNAAHTSSPIQNAKPVEPVSFYPCILPL